MSTAYLASLEKLLLGKPPLHVRVTHGKSIIEYQIDRWD